MRRCLCFSLLALGLMACEEGDGASCLLDSDCPDFSHVCIESTCRPAGEVPDAGGARDGSTRRDSGPEEDAGGAMDSGAGDDAGPPGEGGMLDAGDAGMMMACENVAGDWVISAVNAEVPCGDAMMGLGVTIAAGTMACEFVATSVSMPALDGTFTLDMGNALLGDLTTGTAASVSCNGNYNASGSQFTFICGSCVMNLNRAP